MLMANAVHELHLTLRPHSSGTTRFMYVNVVGILYSTDIPDEKAYLMKRFLSLINLSFAAHTHDHFKYLRGTTERHAWRLQS